MKYKKVILINPCPAENTSGINRATIYPPLGLAYIASVLRERNIQVEIIDANIMRLDNSRVLEIIRGKNPDLVGISLNIVTANTGIMLSRQIKETTDFDVVLGGSFASAVPESIFQKSKADILVIGEGERTIAGICEGKPLAEIKGIAWRQENGDFVINEPVELIDNLDTIPMPAYDLIPPFRLYRSRACRLPMAAIFTSRGCPYHCTFCNHNIFGKKFRAFSPKRVIEEMEFLISKYGIRQFDILDDNCSFDLAHLEEILDLIIGKKFNILINLQNGIRVDNLTYSTVKKLKMAGVFKVGIGCESADSEILKEVKKNVNLEKIKQAVQWFSREGIITYLFFIIGFPNDTKESITKTIDFARELNPTGANFSALVPFPGTEIYLQLKELGLLKDGLGEGLLAGFTGGKLYHICRYLTQDEILALQAQAYKQFYLRPAKIWEHLRQIRSFSEIRWYLDILRDSSPIVNRFRKRQSRYSKIEEACRFAKGRPCYGPD